jgi:leucyl aminopeptidase
MQLIADLKLPIKVTAIVPCCENAVDNKSFQPSDVIKSYSKHTIEIIDTDAEGRLILADGLSYLIKNFRPEIVVDVATLTGSAVGLSAMNVPLYLPTTTRFQQNCKNR